MNIKWLYERDYEHGELQPLADYWTSMGYRVFTVGYSAMDVSER